MMTAHFSWPRPRWLLLAGGFLLPACGTKTEEPKQEFAAPRLTIVEPRANQTYKPGEEVIIRGRAEVTQGRWAPTLLSVKLDDKKNKREQYGSRSIRPDYTKSTESFEFETSFRAPQHPCKANVHLKAMRSVAGERGGSTIESPDTSIGIEVAR